MVKVAIVVLADTETHWDVGRVVNALEAVKELKGAGDKSEPLISFFALTSQRLRYSDFLCREISRE